MANYPLQDIVIFGAKGAPNFTAEWALDMMLRAANEGRGKYWRILTEIYESGISEKVVRFINTSLAKSPITATLRLDAKRRTVDWEIDKKVLAKWLADKEPELTADEIRWLYSLCLARLIELGVFDRLKRCEACENFYIGGPRAKWCSEKCGSLIRVRRKRKLDKGRQML